MIISSTTEKYCEKVKTYMRTYTKHDYQNCEVGKVLDRLYDPSGKMIRAQLVILCGKICQKLNGLKNEYDNEILFKMAALIELTHYTSLIHDDIIDDSPIRRNKPSIQNQFGKNTAVLAGDILLSRIYHQLVVEGIDEISLMMTKLLEEMCVGEIVQDIRRYDIDSGMKDYLEAIKGKTALLFSTACKIGCICENADDEVKDIFAKLGENLGYMFQIRDDYLDFVSNNKLEGKNTCRDLFDGIYTFPLLAILENSEAKTRFENCIGKKSNEELNDLDFIEIRNMIDEFKGFDKTKEYINQLAKECFKNIDSLKEKIHSLGNECSELELLTEIVNNVRTI